MITRLKKPPYSKEFKAYNLSDDFGLGFLYCGSRAWEAKKQISPSSVILPPNEKPDDYDWSFFKGQTVIANVIGDSDLTYRKRIAFYILSAGAKQVLFILPQEFKDFPIGALIATQLVSCHERYVR